MKHDVEAKTYSIRQYAQKDIPKIVELCKQMAETPRKGKDNYFKTVAFNAEKVYKKLNDNTRNIHFFTNLVTDEHGKIVGVLSGEIYEYAFSDECFAADLVLYFTPEYSNMGAARELINSFVSWAKDLKVHEVMIGSSSGYKQEQFCTMMRRFGFNQTRVGFSKEF